MELETVNKLYLKLSQVATAATVAFVTLGRWLGMREEDE